MGNDFLPHLPALDIYNNAIDKLLECYVENIINNGYDKKGCYNDWCFSCEKELCKNWKIIKQEAINALENAPKLNIARNYADWVDNENYFKTINNVCFVASSGDYSNLVNYPASCTNVLAIGGTTLTQNSNFTRKPLLPFKAFCISLVCSVTFVRLENEDSATYVAIEIPMIQSS